MQRYFLTLGAAPPAIIAASLLVGGLLQGTWALAAPAPEVHGAEAAASPAAAHVQVENAWIPRPPPGAEVAAAYLTIRNSGREPAVLVGVDCALATAAMLHESSVVAGESRMRPVDRLTIPPGRSVTLKPGGLHVMLHGLTSALEVGQSVPLVLHFAAGADIRVSARVRPLGSQ